MQPDDIDSQVPKPRDSAWPGVNVALSVDELVQAIRSQIDVVGEGRAWSAGEAFGH